jgi:23S rRNA (cytidine2498-2'-O)-methyltransferase
VSRDDVRAPIRPRDAQGLVPALPPRTLHVPEEALRPGAPAKPGELLWTTRPHAERDLVDELWLARAGDGRVVGPSLVASRGAPRDALGRPAPTFARQGFTVGAVVACEEPALTEAVAHAVLAARPEHGRYAVQLWVPDADATNPLVPRLEPLRAALGHAPTLGRYEPNDTRLIQVCLAAPALAYVGSVALGEALSRAPGGRERMRVDSARPSRAARKLEEAFAWAGIAPGAGELCVDLGAAPGGFTFVVRARGARVIAVDPAPLAHEIAADPGVRTVRGSAFTYEPEAPVDFLLCDMAFRPIDVAALLAKWARRRWARTLIANFKLPMKRRAEMALHLRALLEQGGWKSVRARQLYHDRDEITVCARL